MKQTSLLKTLLLLCALVVGSVSGWAGSITFADLGLKNSVQYSDPFDGGDFTVTFAGGSNDGKYYTTGSGIRVYGGGSMTIAAKSGNISTIVITYDGSSAPSSNDVVSVGTYNMSTHTWTGDAASVVFTRPSGSGHWRVQSITVTLGGTTTCATPTFSPAAGVYTSAQNVTISTTTEDATIYYTEDGSTPTASSTPYTGAIAVSATTTIKAIAVKGGDESYVASATYTIYPVLHAGTELDPYTVADARNAIEANTGVSSVYATGIVSEIVTAYSSVNKNISFNISADGLTTSAQLQAYRCKKGDGGSDPDVADIQVGDVVIVKGNLTKYSSTYEFAQDNVLISLEHPTTPLITVTPTSLTGFTYGLGSGPSNVKTFSVEGSNLTENITLSLGVSSNYEMSLTENNGYTNELSLTPTTGTVAATDIYVRLKAGLAVNASYEGTVTLTSTGAIDKAVSLAGSVTQPNFTWDLSTDQTETATGTEMTWTGIQATMRVDKGSATTATNNYYPGTGSPAYTSTRFYKNSILTITPVSGYSISSVVFIATTEGYATALKNSTWTNATAVASEKTVTVTSTKGLSAISATIGATCGFTAVKVYYEEVFVPATITTAEYATFVSDKATDFSATGITVYTATDEETQVQLNEVTSGKIPANTPVVLYKAGADGSAINVPVIATADAPAGTNDLRVSTGTDVKNMYVLSKKNDKVGFRVWKGSSDLSAGKVYLLGKASYGAREFIGFDDDVTAIEAVKTQNVENGQYFNLAGQRVAQPTKGLYIVNGKKVIIK